jgi:hypothetical protein
MTRLVKLNNRTAEAAASFTAAAHGNYWPTTGELHPAALSAAPEPLQGLPLLLLLPKQQML